MKDQFSRYLDTVAVYVAENPHQRFGQAAFNVLWTEHPEIADLLRGGTADPFHDDHHVPEFLTLVRLLLEQHPGSATDSRRVIDKLEDELARGFVEVIDPAPEFAPAEDAFALESIPGINGNE